MAGRRQIAALKLINTIRQHELDAIGAQLSGLRAQQTSLTEQSAALTQRAIAEQTGSTLETQAYLPAYLSSVDRQQRGLAAEGDALSGQIDTLEDALFAQFRILGCNPDWTSIQVAFSHHYTADRNQRHSRETILFCAKKSGYCYVPSSFKLTISLQSHTSTQMV